MRKFHWLTVMGLVALFAVAGCSANDAHSGWVLKDSVRPGGRLQTLPKVPNGSFWSQTCETGDRSEVIGKVGHRLILQRDPPGAEVIALDPATGDWEVLPGVPGVWDGKPLYAAGYARVGEAEWIWGLPRVALYRPGPGADWREASIGFVDIKTLGGVTFALGNTTQRNSCAPTSSAALYRHDGDDHWTRLRDNIAAISAADGRLFIVEATGGSLRLLVSPDAGATWTPAQVELAGIRVDVVSYADGFAMSTGRDVLTSQDGLTWQRVALPDGVDAPVHMVASDFGPLAWDRTTYHKPGPRLLRLVDGRLELFAHQPPEAGDLGVVGRHLAVVGPKKGAVFYDPDDARWHPVQLALGALRCVAQDAGATYAGQLNNINRLDRGADTWQALPLVGRMTGCPIPTDIGLVAYIQDHPDAPDPNAFYDPDEFYPARYDDGAWHLLEPAVRWTTMRHDGVRFACEGDVIRRYDTDGQVETIGTLNSGRYPCRLIQGVGRDYLMIKDENGRKLTLVDLNTGESRDASNGLLNASGKLLNIRELFDTDLGLFLTIYSGTSSELGPRILMRWDTDKNAWAEVELPPLEDGPHVRAFAPSQSTVYATTARAIWRLDRADGTWTQLLDWDGPPFQYDMPDTLPFERRPFTAWDDVLLLTAEDFRVYRYIPPRD